jgi:hypothetical protein
MNGTIQSRSPRADHDLEGHEDRVKAMSKWSRCSAIARAHLEAAAASPAGRRSIVVAVRGGEAAA